MAAPPGRPTALTADVRQRILALVQAGNFREVAARAAGVAPRTLYTWLARGKRESQGLYHEFRQALLSAEQCAEIRMVARVLAGAEADTADARWYLERKFPERWSRDSKRVRDLERDLADLRKVITDLAGGAGATAACP